MRQFSLVLLVVALIAPAAAHAQQTGVVRTAIHRRVIAEPAASAGSQDALEPVNPQSLRREPVKVYRLGPGDVLGMQVDGVLGNREEPIPVHYPPNGEPPSTGYPVPVREDGTISLPLVDPIPVAGLSLAEAEDAVRRRLTEETKILNPGQDRILVSLMHRRTTRVLVVREDSVPGNDARGAELRRGQIVPVDLRAGEDDVLHALVASGGLPGYDARNEVTVLRGRSRDAASSSAPVQRIRSEPIPPETIPLRVDPQAPPIIAPPMALQSGDVLRVDARNREVYYTGGQLPGGERWLPRDRDLDVLGAVAASGGVPFQAGRLPPTRVTVVRRLPDGSQLPLRLDLRRARHDPPQRLALEPGDFVLLEYRPRQMLLNFGLSNFNLYTALQWLRK